MILPPPIPPIQPWLWPLMGGALAYRAYRWLRRRGRKAPVDLVACRNCGAVQDVASTRAKFCGQCGAELGADNADNASE